MKRLFWTNKPITLKLMFLSMIMVLFSFINIVVPNTSEAANTKAIEIIKTKSASSNVTITNDDVLLLIKHLRKS